MKRREQLANEAVTLIPIAMIMQTKWTRDRIDEFAFILEHDQVFAFITGGHHQMNSDAISAAIFRNWNLI